MNKVTIKEIGNLAEEFFKDECERKKIYYIKTEKYNNYKGICELNVEGIKKLIKHIKGHERVLLILSKFVAGWPDFITIEKGIIVFHEIKANTGRPSKIQLEVAKILEKYGYEVRYSMNLTLRKPRNKEEEKEYHKIRLFWQEIMRKTINQEYKKEWEVRLDYDDFKKMIKEYSSQFE
jgi:hypothetical protein